MNKAIIFDMDGLMVDSTPTWTEAETSLVKKYGKEYSHEIRKKYLGMRVSGMIRILIDEYELPISPEEGEKFLKTEMRINFAKPSVQLLPGCDKLVKELSNSGKYVLAVASSSPKDIIETMIKRFDFENDFDVIVSGEEVVNGKPAPDIFLRTAELLKVDQKNCLVIEDAPHGIDAAKAGGMKAIAVNNAMHYKPEDFKKADLFVHSLEEIHEETIERIF